MDALSLKGVPSGMDDNLTGIIIAGYRADVNATMLKMAVIAVPLGGTAKTQIASRLSVTCSADAPLGPNEESVQHGPKEFSAKV